MDAVLDRLARLDKAGQRAVHRLREALGACEQQLLPARDQHHHGRRHARIDDVPARRALLCALATLVACRRSAAAAELMATVPFDDLEGTAGEGEPIVRELQEQRAQPAPFPPRRQRRVRCNANRDTADAFELAEIVLRAADAHLQHVRQASAEQLDEAAGHGDK